MKKAWASFISHPLSFCLRGITYLAAAITGFVILFMIAYILVKGVPHITLDLFAWKYTSDNASLMPALVNTIYITVISLLMAVPLGIGSSIYMVEYAKRGNKLVKWTRLTAETLSASHPLFTDCLAICSF